LAKFYQISPVFPIENALCTGLSQSRKKKGKKNDLSRLCFRVTHKNPKHEEGRQESDTGQVLDVGSLYQRFGRLNDKRKARGKRYALAMILLGIFLAKLCGEAKPSGIAEWVALQGEWIAQVLGLKQKAIPRHHTCRRTLAVIVDTQEFEVLLREHHRYCGETGYLVVASMDGKLCRGPLALEASERLCLLALFLPGEGVTLAQIAVESKQNEISAAPRLLGWVDLRNKVVIGDALHTQRQISIQIGKAGGNYLIVASCVHQNIQPGQLTIHADRGSSMISKPVALLMADLGVTKTHSRPHVSNDNPFSESHFKTLKYRPDYPEPLAASRMCAVGQQNFSADTTTSTIIAL
jgi:predicted transposase YbfD/YdcC